MEWSSGGGAMIKRSGKGSGSKGKKQRRDDEGIGAWKGGGEC